MRNRKRIRMTKMDFIITRLNYALLFILMLLFILPLANVLSNSLSSYSMLAAGKVYIYPRKITLEAYRTLMGINDIWRGYLNSFIYMIIGTSVNLVMTIMLAYPLSKSYLHGKKIVICIFMVTMFFGGGLIPTFLLVRSLGLINTVWALCLPGAINISNMIVARTFFITSIPSEIYDAADIDGAGDMLTLFRIVLPLSAPILAVLVLWYAVGHWNSYFSALIYINDNKLYPLQMVIRDYLMNDDALEEMLGYGGMDYTKTIVEMMGKREVLKYAIIIVSALPMLLLYPFIQKHFVKGIMVGSLKG